MREFCTSGSVGGLGGNSQVYPADGRRVLQSEGSLSVILSASGEVSARRI
jgi:hypothetical protein